MFAVEVCRSAANGQKFKETPNWANPLMSRLIEANMVEINDRGHYRYISEPENTAPAAAGVVGEDYFPDDSEENGEEQQRWIAPHIAEIRGRPGRNFKNQKGRLFL